MTRGLSVLAALLLACAAAQARELKFQVVDGATGTPLTGARVTRFYCPWEPVEFLIPKVWWKPMESVYSDPTGVAQICKPAPADCFFIEADGYAAVEVSKCWYHYYIHEHDQKECAAQTGDGCYVIPLHPKPAH